MNCFMFPGQPFSGSPSLPDDGDWLEIVALVRRFAPGIAKIIDQGPFEYIKSQVTSALQDWLRQSISNRLSSPAGFLTLNFDAPAAFARRNGGVPTRA